MGLVRLDPIIREWAFCAIFVFVICALIIRQNVLSIVKPKPKTQIWDCSPKNIVQRSKTLRSTGAQILLPKSWHLRKLFFTHPKDGVLHHPPPALGVLEKMAMNHDPQATTGGMVQFGMTIVLNVFMAYLVNLFFSGFVVAKFPLPLPYRCKILLQRGVEVPLLDVSYISSLSWYFCVLFGGGSLVTVARSLLESGQGQSYSEFGSDDLLMVMGPMAGGKMAGGGGTFDQPDAGRQYEEELKAYSLSAPDWKLQNIEELVTRKLNKTTI
eukprot:GHVP01038011.1.p1 GENE.GHVP01038011.1~~GHVP01038011.1.p1  ORF type:complete len:280 (+),score=49.64 GHVP01038011.1:34-840(+)